MPPTLLSTAHDLAGELVGGIGRRRGEELFEVLTRERPQRCLELGFAHGASTLYIASALEENGRGTLVSVDNLSARERRPAAAEVLAEAGLDHRVELVYEPTSYNHYLRRRIRERTTSGVCEPELEFCFIDGAHTWIEDGLAFFCVDKLLKPGGLLLLDDLKWRLDAERWPEVPEEERAVAQVGEVFELLVSQHPAYAEIRSDGTWGWARKGPQGGPQRRVVVRRGFLEEARLVVRRMRLRRGA